MLGTSPPLWPSLREMNVGFLVHILSLTIGGPNAIPNYERVFSILEPLLSRTLEPKQGALDNSSEMDALWQRQVQSSFPGDCAAVRSCVFF